MYKYFAISVFLIFNFIFSETITGYQLAKMVDDKNQPKSSKSEISMTLINLKKDRKKTKEMISISKNDGEKMLLFFKTPKRDKGVGFLKIENDDNDKLSLFIPKLKSYEMSILIEALSDLLGEIKQEITGIRPGEKLHETLINNDEIRYTWNVNDMYMISNPHHELFKSSTFTEMYEQINKVENLTTYSSDVAEKITKDELKEKIESSKLL